MVSPALDDKTHLCPICRYAAIPNQPGSSGLDPPCPHCRACSRRLLAGLLFPAVIVIVGLLFAGRHANSHPLAHSVIARVVDGVLLAAWAAYPIYGMWFVWYSAGLRWRMLLLVTLQLGLSCYLLWAVLLCSAGPP